MFNVYLLMFKIRFAPEQRLADKILRQQREMVFLGVEDENTVLVGIVVLDDKPLVFEE